MKVIYCSKKSRLKRNGNEIVIYNLVYGQVIDQNTIYIWRFHRDFFAFFGSSYGGFLHSACSLRCKIVFDSMLCRKYVFNIAFNIPHVMFYDRLRVLDYYTNNFIIFHTSRMIGYALVDYKPAPHRLISSCPITSSV